MEKLNLKNIALYSILGILINCTIYAATSALNLPVWLDTIGTCLVAIFGGFIPACIAGIISELLSAIRYNDINEMIFSLIHIAQAAIFAIFSPKIKNFISLSGTVLISIFFRIAIIILIVFIYGESGNAYETISIEALKQQELPLFVCYTLGVSSTNILEAFGMLTLLYIAYKIISYFHKNNNTELIRK